MSATSFLHSSFLQAVNPVMLWPVHVHKIPQAYEHLYPAKLQTRYHICCACQPVCPFIPTDSGVPRTVKSQKSLQPKTVHGCVPVGAAHSRRFIESVKMMVCVIRASCWEAFATVLHVTASTSMVRLEVVTLWAPLSSCTVLPPCLTVITMSCGLLLASTSICISALNFSADHS